jgi:hypothetical protein
MFILSDILGVKIGNPQIEKDIEEKGKTEDRKVHPIGLCPYLILDLCINS